MEECLRLTYLAYSMIQCRHIMFLGTKTVLFSYRKQLLVYAEY
jgi:hypothetical protein